MVSHILKSFITLQVEGGVLFVIVPGFFFSTLHPTHPILRIILLTYTGGVEVHTEKITCSFVCQKKKSANLEPPLLRSVHLFGPQAQKRKWERDFSYKTCKWPSSQVSNYMLFMEPDRNPDHQGTNMWPKQTLLINHSTPLHQDVALKCSWSAVSRHYQSIRECKRKSIF